MVSQIYLLSCSFFLHEGRKPWHLAAPIQVHELQLRILILWTYALQPERISWYLPLQLERISLPLACLALNLCFLFIWDSFILLETPFWIYHFCPCGLGTNSQVLQIYLYHSIVFGQSSALPLSLLYISKAGLGFS